MKTQKITDQSKLVGGQCYIRALINCHGKAWLEVYRVLGKAHVRKASKYSGKDTMVSTIANHRHAKVTDYYLSTLGIENNQRIQDLACYRFSNKLYNKLNKMLDRRADLLAFINKRKLTEEELLDIINSWEFQIWSDELMHDDLVKNCGCKPFEQEKEYLNDQSLKDVLDKYYFLDDSKPMKENKPMYTAEQILGASPMGKMLIKQGKPYKGILTSEEALQRSVRTGTLCIQEMSDKKVFYFTDDHIFGYPVLPKATGSCTQVFPCYVVPRDELPDGMVTTIEQYIMIFQKGDRQITSIEELVDFLNSEEE